MAILMDDCLHYGRSTQMHLEAGGLQPVVIDSRVAAGIAQVPCRKGVGELERGKQAASAGITLKGSCLISLSSAEKGNLWAAAVTAQVIIRAHFSLRNMF